MIYEINTLTQSYQSYDMHNMFHSDPHHFNGWPLWFTPVDSVLFFSGPASKASAGGLSWACDLYTSSSSSDMFSTKLCYFVLADFKHALRKLPEEVCHEVRKYMNKCCLCFFFKLLCCHPDMFCSMCLKIWHLSLLVTREYFVGCEFTLWFLDGNVPKHVYMLYSLLTLVYSIFYNVFLAWILVKFWHVLILRWHAND